MAFRKVAQFKEMSLEYVSPDGPGTARFFTDLPGGILTERTGGKPMAQTNTNKAPATITIPLNDAFGAPLEGTLYYPRVEPPTAGALQLRSGVVWYRTIGVYLSGPAGEFFETAPISIGV